VCPCPSQMPAAAAAPRPSGARQCRTKARFERKHAWVGWVEVMRAQACSRPSNNVLYTDMFTNPAECLRLLRVVVVRVWW